MRICVGLKNTGVHEPLLQVLYHSHPMKHASPINCSYIVTCQQYVRKVQNKRSDNFFSFSVGCDMLFIVGWVYRGLNAVWRWVERDSFQPSHPQRSYWTMLPLMKSKEDQCRGMICLLFSLITGIASDTPRKLLEVQNYITAHWYFSLRISVSWFKHFLLQFPIGVILLRPNA